MIELYRNPWRAQFASEVCQVEHELTLAAPYIKASEAKLVCDLLSEPPRRLPPRLRVLTDLRTESVLRGSLDMDALKLFYERCPHAEIMTLPSLHAKVYVFDHRLAVVTSANLTSGGLDTNYEYGVGIRNSEVIARILADVDAYAQVGNLVPPRTIEELSRVAADITDQYKRVVASATREAQQRFNASLRLAKLEFSKALVGQRSAYSLFCDAILFALRCGPLPTRQLHPFVQTLLPDLCDDSVELVINGERFGKAWKHHVRNAQQALKRRGAIVFDGKAWRVTSP